MWRRIISAVRSNIPEYEGLGNDNFISDNAIIRFGALRQAEIVSKTDILEWSSSVAVTSSSISISREWAEKPYPGLIKIFWEQRSGTFSTESHELTQLTHEPDWGPQTEFGDPTHYWLRGGNLHFWPIPSRSFTLRQIIVPILSAEYLQFFNDGSSGIRAATWQIQKTAATVTTKKMVVNLTDATTTTPYEKTFATATTVALLYEWLSGLTGMQCFWLNEECTPQDAFEVMYEAENCYGMDNVSSLFCGLFLPSNYHKMLTEGVIADVKRADANYGDATVHEQYYQGRLAEYVAEKERKRAQTAPAVIENVYRRNRRAVYPAPLTGTVSV